MPVPPDRVILGRPEAEGLYGQEAPGIARRMFSTQTGGQGAGGGTLGGGRHWVEHREACPAAPSEALGPAAVLAVEQAFTNGLVRQQPTAR